MVARRIDWRVGENPTASRPSFELWLRDDREEPTILLHTGSIIEETFIATDPELDGLTLILRNANDETDEVMRDLSMLYKTQRTFWKNADDRPANERIDLPRRCRHKEVLCECTVTE